ncbi:MAG: hypothetical protein HY851_01390 [candidate division Zixibacteria bacterium]|nr:hypothetical protein [candidate division Zixibacteria bacterium]
MRKTCIVFIGAALWLVTGAIAQTPRTIKGAASVEAFRPIGERRLWTFVSRDTVLGRLISGIDSRTTTDDESALVIKGGVRIDFQKIGGEQAMAVQTEFHVSDMGQMLADKLDFQVQERQEQYSFERAGDAFEGYFTRNGEKVKQSVPWPRQYYALDAYFVDQLEIYLATRDLTEHATIEDTIFVPQVLSTATVAAQVGVVEWRELWKGKFDSVIAVQFTQPQQMTAFITPDHRLARVDYPGLNTRAYLDLVQKTQAEGAGSTPQNLATWVSLSAHYLIYTIPAGLVALFLAARAFTWKDAYFGLIFGVIVFGLALVTQYPAQKYVISHFVLPELRQGGNLYLWGALPALAGGVIQEILKLLGIYALIFHRQPAISRWAKLGVFVAAGFALFEAFKITEPTLVLSWQLFERGARLTFHASSGALLAIALGSDSARRYLIIAGMMLLDAFMFYLPVFVQAKVATPEVLHFILAVVAIGTVLIAVIAMSKMKLRISAPSESSPADEAGV